MIEQLKLSISKSKELLVQRSPLLRRLIWYYFPTKKEDSIKRIIQFKFTTVNNIELIFERETLIQEKIDPWKDYCIKNTNRYSGKVDPKETLRKEDGNLFFVTKVTGYWKVTRRRTPELKIIMEKSGWKLISEIKK